jgi:hypothetical protein
MRELAIEERGAAPAVTDVDTGRPGAGEVRGKLGKIVVTMR